MNRNDDEKLTDILMGEAVLALLHGGGPISSHKLIVKLQTMAESEKKAARKQACERAIAEVRSSMAEARSQSRPESRDRDNVRLLFSNESASDDKKKH